MKSELLVKVQYDSKNKLMKKEFNTLSELKSAVTACYPKRLGNKEIELKYEDSDGDWFSITEDSDVQAFKEYATSLGNKKAIVLVETTGDKKEESKEEIVASETEKLIEGVREALDEIKLDEEQKDDKKELKDFRFANAFGEVEALLNSDEKVRPGHIIKAVINAVKGTKAEIHFKRLIKRIKGGKRSPSHGRMWGRKHCGKKSRSPKKGDCEKNRASSSSPEEGFGGFHPMTPHEMVGFEHCGPMGYPFPNMMPPCYPGFGGFGEFGPRNHGCGKGKAMKFFRKFMKAFKDGSSSSDSSSTERKEKRKEKKEVNMEKRKEYRLKRPQVLEKPSEIKVKVLSTEVGNYDKTYL